MATTDHRMMIGQAIAGDLNMHLLKENSSVKVYVGLWSVWWSDGQGISDVSLALQFCTHPSYALLLRLQWVV